MRREDRKIGDTFTISDGTRLIVTKIIGGDTCYGCYFDNDEKIDCNDESDWLGACSGVNRDDGSSVIVTEVRSSEECIDDDTIIISENKLKEILCGNACVYYNDCNNSNMCLFKIIKRNGKKGR